MSTEYNGRDTFQGNVVSGTKLDTVVLWKGTALPVGAANEIPQNGFFCLMDSLSAPTSAVIYIQTSATLSSPVFVEALGGAAPSTAYYNDMLELNAATLADGDLVTLGNRTYIVTDDTIILLEDQENSDVKLRLEDFTSYANQTAIDAVYVPNSAQIVGDFTNNWLEWTLGGNGTTDKVTFDVSGAAGASPYAIIEMKVHHIDSGVSAAGVLGCVRIGLCSDTTVTNGVGVWIGRFGSLNPANECSIHRYDGTTPIAGDPEAIEDMAAGDDGWVRITITNTDYRIQAYSDAWVTSVFDQSYTTSLRDYRYLIIQDYSTGGGDVHNAYIELLDIMIGSDKF